MWLLVTLSAACVCSLAHDTTDDSLVYMQQRVLDVGHFVSLREGGDPWSGDHIDRCYWFPACICRNESRFTNGTYKLMVNCTHAGLETVPSNIPDSTTVLTLDENNITDIKPGVFQHLTLLKYLDLSNNNIKYLRKGIFSGLENLHTLEISGNKIRYNKMSIHSTVFRPLKKLVRLNLHQNLKGISESEKFPTDALSDLTNLQQLLIDGLEPQSFRHTVTYMKDLSVLELSSDFGRCNLSQISVGMFKNISNITNLKLSNCNIDRVENGSFSELKNLTSLDLSYNERLHFQNLANITYGLQHNTMRELRLTKIHETYGDCTRLERKHLVYLKNMSVTDIYLDANRLAYLTSDAVDFIPRTIQKLSLSNNMMLAGEYLHKLFVEPVFENLRYLTLAEQTMNYDALHFFSNKTKSMLMALDSHLNEAKLVTDKLKNLEEDNTGAENGVLFRSMDRFSNTEQDILCSNCHGNGLNYDIILYIPPSLIELDLSGLRIRNELKNICICQPNFLLRLNLERNVFWNWQGPIAGLTHLLNLNLAWNSCDNISLDVFDNMPKLLQLNLTRNFLERFFREDTEGRIFQKLVKLKELLLGDNKLRFLPRNVFRGLKSLQGLDLSNNFLIHFDVSFDPIAPLQLLDLQNNLLDNIAQNVMDKFDDMAHSDSIFTAYYIELAGNKMSCKCKDIEFVRWVSRTKVKFVDLNTYKCTYENGEQKNFSQPADIYKQMLKDCPRYTVLIVSVVIGFIVFVAVILAGVIYRYRWDLRYFYYSVKLRMKGNMRFVNSDEDDSDFTHDVFVSYASENGRFVKNVVVPELEIKRHMRLLVHDRDFRPGEFVSDNIMQAITTSRKTLILMSKPFLKSDWCIFEMNMARMEAIKTGRNVVCLVILEEVPTSNLPLEIIEIIRQHTYIELPSDSNHMDMFWDKVHEALAQ